MSHEINVQLELNDLSCSLLRLISSYIMNTSNFTIDEMDEFKFLLHETLCYVKQSITPTKPVCITFLSDEDMIQATILVETLANGNKHYMNQAIPLYQIAQHLLKDFSMEESQDQKLIFTLKKEKRAFHG